MRVDLKDIVVASGGGDILSHLTFSLASGTFSTILGASGAGKTTVVSVISGLVPQDEGEVLFDGRSVDGLATHRRGVSVVFQDSRLFPHMSVAQNVAFPLRVRGVSRGERTRRADALLEAVQLPGFGPRRTQSLSGGQRQRVALARAFAAEPRLILLDEPFSGLDESLREDMRSLVLDLHERTGITMLMVTHDATEALTMSDQVLYLSHGHLVQAGSPADIVLAPASGEVAGSFGTLSAIEGVVREGAFSSGRLRMPAPGLSDGGALLVVRGDGAPRVLALGDTSLPGTGWSATGAGRGETLGA